MEYSFKVNEPGIRVYWNKASKLIRLDGWMDEWMDEWMDGRRFKVVSQGLGQ